MKLRSQMPELKGAAKWLNGEVSRSDLVGEKPTLFYFWSVSCHLCKESILDVHKVRDDYSGKLNVVAVHMPLSKKDKDIENIEKVAIRLGISQPIFIDNELKLSDEFENNYVPAYYVFDETGLLRHYQSGKSSIKILQNRLDRILD